MFRTPAQYHALLRPPAPQQPLADVTRRFLHGHAGATWLEYALLLGLLVASGLTAYLLAGAGTDRVFSMTAGLLGPRAEAERVASADPGAVVRAGGAAPPRSDWLRDHWAVVSSVVRGAVWVGLWAAIVLIGHRLWRLMRPNTKADVSAGHPFEAATPPDMLTQILGKRQQIRRMFARGLECAAPVEPLVRHVMSSDVVTIAPDTSSSELEAIMRERRVRHLLVCRDKHRVAGVVSDRDLRQRSGLTAEAIMTPEPITVSPETPLAPVITLLLTKGISCVPVVDGTGVLCGILTSTDLMLSLQCTLQILAGMATGLWSSDASTPERIDDTITRAPVSLAESYADNGLSTLATR